MTPALLLFARRFALIAGLLWVGAAGAADEFLPPTEAFKYEARVEGGQLTVQYRIHDDYYLYRERLGFATTTPGVTLGAPQFPAGEDHEDDYFGRQVVYRDAVAISLPVAFDGQVRDFELRLRLQGCADAGLCYPPQTRLYRIDFNAGTASLIGRAAAGEKPAYREAKRPPGGLPYMLALAFIGGAILNLMPCVFPILSLNVLAFARSSDHDRHLHSWVYTGGVIASFVAVAALLIIL